MKEFNPPFYLRGNEELISITEGSIKEWKVETIQEALEELKKRGIEKGDYKNFREKIYLKFNENRSALRNQIESNKTAKNFLLKLFSFFIPSGNPDFENKFQFVTYWKIEFDTKENYTSRELGFDKHNKVLIAAPFRNNHGLWSDEELSLYEYDKFLPVKILKEEFENDWKEFVMNFKL